MTPIDVEETPQQNITEEFQTPREGAAKSSKPIKAFPKINPPFPQRLKKWDEDERFKNFISVFKTLLINLPLVEHCWKFPLGLGVTKLTAMRLLMADHFIKHPIDILYYILVKVDRFKFPANFVILDCEIDTEGPIILVRPFLATGKALVDVESGELKF
ncbi:uncharacterized protein LOC125830142 [Solanum verrucosum]|uniref:uncharacterized protein LOC125830142 n=1 Tax=Solanum verrucosum TaxID=315347 RepID=UPI0020D1E54A|nr:uncharacterized protein LOC125830142 [Solanum verrucosum]